MFPLGCRGILSKVSSIVQKTIKHNLLPHQPPLSQQMHNPIIIFSHTNALMNKNSEWPRVIQKIRVCWGFPYPHGAVGATTALRNCWIIPKYLSSVYKSIQCIMGHDCVFFLYPNVAKHLQKDLKVSQICSYFKSIYSDFLLALHFLLNSNPLWCKNHFCNSKTL